MTTDVSPTAPPLPHKAGDRRHWHNLIGAARALALTHAARAHGGLVLVVADSSHTAQALARELRFFAHHDGSDDSFILPDWETLPYDVFSPHQEIISERLAALHRLPRSPRGLLIVPIATLLQRLPPPEFLEATTFLLAPGDELNLDRLREQLERAGYRHVSEVSEHGEFAVRGSLVDLFPMGSEIPYRIDLFDDEVESIRTFDP